MERVREDVYVGVVPVDELAVHPYLVGLGDWHRSFTPFLIARLRTDL